jgi:hypothetical protein
MKHVLLIDCFRSHNTMAYVCFTNGLIPIHLFSSKKSFQNSFFSVVSNYFSKCFIYENPEQFLEDIKDYKDTIQFVFGCTDSSQQLKDTIDVLLNLDNKHSLDFANARYNKFELYKLLNQPAADSNFEEFKQQYGDCIIKPAPIEQSGGCEGVEFVNSTSTIEEKEGLFISKFFEGDEYAVDLVSCEGKHKLVSVWRYVRQSDEKVWKDKVELMRYEEDPVLINQIYKVVTQWLNTVDHKFGPTHVELKHNNGEFFCIEINFRLNGHMAYQALARALENNQADLTRDCYTNKSKFDGELIAYKTRGYIFRIYFLNDRVRKYSEIPWTKIESSPSVVAMYKHVWPWGDVKVSKKTYGSSTAIIIMYNENKSTLEEHEQTVRELFK